VRNKVSLNFLESDWFVGLLVSVVVFVLGDGNLLQNLERKAYDLGVSMTQLDPSERIAVIAIDQQSLDNIGRWPWPRDVIAEMIEKLTAAKAKVIASTLLFSEPQRDAGLGYIEQLVVLNNARLAAEAGAAAERTAALVAEAAHIAEKKSGASKVGAGRTALLAPQTPVAPLPVVTPPAAADPLASLLAEAERKLNTDRHLATAIAQAGNVALPITFQLVSSLETPEHLLPEFVTRHTVKIPEGKQSKPLSALEIDAGVVDVLGAKAAAVGHLNALQDVDGAIRSEALVLDYFGQGVPSLALLVAARSLNLKPADIHVRAGEFVKLGKLKIATDASFRMLPFYYRDSDGDTAFPVDSFTDVRSGKISSEKYRDKIVLIGLTAAGIASQFITPVSAAMPAVLLQAHTVSSILSEHYFVSPVWGLWIENGLFLLIALYLVFLLPRFSAVLGVAVTSLLLVLLVTAHFGLIMSQLIWLKLMLPATLLLAGHLLLTTKHLLLAERGGKKSPVESAKPAQSADTDEMVKTLVLDEGRTETYASTLVLDRSAEGLMNKLKLGRYQIDKELGKGAMGVVYQGHDPQTNRSVAIKTMALAQEFDADELADVKERFFREAETVRRLKHANIVSVFEAGEDQSLAYIAMEFLSGKDLVAQTRPDKLLPLPTVLSIIARVADALDYAHANQVVHRDIKPANIMYEPASDQVKVADFGIARITDSSKTKTGMVLGTPSYMSPEQLAGKKIDGRSDLFSLGVTLYQMCTGQLPFVAESMAQLMLKISNAAHPDIRNIAPDVPDCLAAVIDKVLVKNPDQRYQTGSALAHDLRACLSILEMET